MDYRIVYSDRRTLSLQITRECEVVVRAPRRATRERIEAFVLAHTEWINKKLEIQRERLQKHPELDESEVEALILRARAVLPDRVAHFSALMGVEPTHISINRARTRYGSCSDKGRINFSCYLMRFDERAIDYVVVHELAHLKHLNHSRSFWAFVESILPDYRQRKRLLK